MDSLFGVKWHQRGSSLLFPFLGNLHTLLGLTLSFAWTTQQQSMTWG